MEDSLDWDWNEFSRDRAHVGSLSNGALLMIYWFSQNNQTGSDRIIIATVKASKLQEKVEIVS